MQVVLILHMMVRCHQSHYVSNALNPIPTWTHFTTHLCAIAAIAVTVILFPVNHQSCVINNPNVTIIIVISSSHHHHHHSTTDNIYGSDLVSALSSTDLVSAFGQKALNILSCHNVIVIISLAVGYYYTLL